MVQSDNDFGLLELAREQIRGSKSASHQPGGDELFWSLMETHLLLDH